MKRAELAGLVVDRLRAEGRDPDGRLCVAELRDRVVPYDVARAALGLATKAEYDLALLALLADPERTKVKGRKLRKAVTRELETPEPGLAVLADFDDTELRVLVGGASEADGGEKPGASDGSGPSIEEAESERAAEDAHGPDGEGPELESEAATGEAAAGETTAPVVSHSACWRCGDELPERTGLRFCPWCGTDQTFRECADCGEEMELAWSYCPICGTRVEEEEVAP